MIDQQQRHIWLAYFISFVVIIGFFSLTIFEVVKRQEEARHLADLEYQYDLLQETVSTSPMTLDDLFLFFAKNRMLGQIYNQDLQLIPGIVFNDFEVKMPTKEIQTHVMKRFKVIVEGESTEVPGILYPATFQNRVYYILLLSKNLDSMQLLKHLQEVLLQGSLLVIMAGMFMSYYLSKLSMKPILKSWEKQKQFSHDASHELRTPITVIMLKSDKLLRYQDDSIMNHAEDIVAIKNESRRMKKLVDDLLLISRSDNGTLLLDLQVVEITQIIGEIQYTYEELIEMTNKELIIEILFNPLVKIDVQRMKQLLMILIDNAMKHTSINDTIKVVTSKAGQRLRIDVINTGEHIEPQHLEHLFERFYQVNPSRNDHSAGLGLAIAKEIAQLHHGSIHVSNIDEGVCFSLYLNIEKPLK